MLGDDPPHALIGGPSGSGKTNLLYAWLGGLCARYSPDELALYLLDFKEGVSFARFAPEPAGPELAAARTAGRGERQQRPRVRAGAAAPPRRGAAAAGAGGQAVRGGEARGAARGGPGRALAADRRGGRRVPGAPGRPGRGDRRGGDAAGGPGPARPLPGHPPGARVSRTSPASRRCGAARGWSGSSRCGSRCPRRAGSCTRPTWPRRPCRGTAPSSTPTPAWSAPTGSCGCPTRATVRTGASCRPTCGTGARPRPRRPGSSTATRCRLFPSTWQPDAAEPVALLGETIDVDGRPATLPAAPRARAQPGRPRHPYRRRLRGAGRGRAVAGRRTDCAVQRRVPRRRRAAVRGGAARGAARTRGGTTGTRVDGLLAADA